MVARRVFLRLTEALANALIGNDWARQVALRSLKKVAYRLIIERWTWPEKVVEEMYRMGCNLIDTVDLALRSNRISPSVRRTVIKVIVNNFYFGMNERRRRFIKDYGFDSPAFLTISPCKVCNLNCYGCYAASSSGSDEKLPYEIVDRIITEKTRLWGSYFTVISGGEPFIYRSDGKGLLDLARNHRDNLFMVYTNGTLITKHVARELGELGNLIPAISVEGLEADTDKRRGKGVHRRIRHAFENLAREGVPYGISVTATRENADLIISDEVIDFYFGKHNVLYCWIFQYMPIGRGFTLDQMVTPKQRLRMFLRTRELQQERGIFVADFWNSGALAGGCISAGRPNNGYLYIDWNGNVTPCVFYPYAACNIVDVYRNGGDLNDVLRLPFFEAIRRWQKEYVLDRDPEDMGNMLRPCIIRDHHRTARRFIDEHSAMPIDEGSREALDDDGYFKGLVDYGERIEELTREIWQREYLDS